MQAVIFPHYGNHEQLITSEDAQRPEPKSDEVLIQVTTSSLNRGDWHYVHGTPFPLRLMAGGIRTPSRNIPGVDAVGIVSAVGNDVTGFNPGDRVIADLSNSGFGGWAEYTTCKASDISLCPSGLTDELAATIPISGVTALQGLRDHAELKAGETVLVNGATGGVGMFAVLISRLMGADVTAVGSSKKAEWLDQLGANHVVHYDATDLMQIDKQYDVVFDAAAYRPFYQMKPILKEMGRYIMVGGSMKQFAQIALLGSLLSKKSGRRYSSFLQRAVPGDIQTLAEWMANNQLKLPAPKVLPMTDASEAMRMMEQRQLTGKICLRFS